MYNLRVFISSKQSEFELERAMLKHEVEAIPRLEADLAEEWSPQRAEVRKVFLERVMAAHFYVGLFGRVYSEPTRVEYLAARENKYREMLIYIKDSVQPEPELAALIAEIRSRHVPKRYSTPQDLLVMFRSHLLDALVRSVEELNWLGKPRAKPGRTRATQTRILAEAGLPNDPATALAISLELNRLIVTRSVNCDD
jgi:Domain of unknown function (DUF4062)